MNRRTYPVIYLTGAPAAGKSTLCRNLAARFKSLTVFAYSEELRHFISEKTTRLLSEHDIRAQSSIVVTAEDVTALDEQLVARVAVERQSAPFIIDSHPVTKESYGYRITGFSIDARQRLDPDVIICLYTSPEITIQRIGADAMGRPMVSRFEADMHTRLQTAVAAQYGVILGKPVYLLDAAVSPGELVELAAKKAGLS